MPFKLRIKKSKKGSITPKTMADLQRQEDISNKYFESIGYHRRLNEPPVSRGSSGGGAVFNLPQSSPGPYPTSGSSGGGAVFNLPQSSPGAKAQRTSNYPSVIQVNPAKPASDSRGGGTSDAFLSLGGGGSDSRGGGTSDAFLSLGGGGYNEPKRPSAGPPSLEDHQVSSDSRGGGTSDAFLSLGGGGGSADAPCGYATGTEIEMPGTKAEDEEEEESQITVTKCDLDDKYKDYITDYVGEHLDIDYVSGSLRPMINHLNETDGPGWRLHLITGGDFNEANAVPGTIFVFAPEGKNLKYAVYKSKGP